MINAIVATVAILASTAAASVGSAIVNNQCEYAVTLRAVPAMPGNCSEQDQTLYYGDKFVQDWTEISNQGGWSIKLNPANASETNIMQYEYTYQGTDVIWYDLSDVNGNPWDGNWEITATSESSTCDPKQSAYRYATDDAYGMQSCNSDAVITVTLCSGDSQDDAGASSASASSASATASSTSISSTPVSIASSYSSAETEVAVATTSTEASTTSSASSTSSSAPSSSVVSLSPTSTEVQSTTFATSTVASSTSNGNLVGPIETIWYTNIETVTHYATQFEHEFKRAPTPAPHAHHHHAARHPHAAHA